MISLKSNLTKKLLSYLFINPHEKLYVNELSRKLDLDKRNLVKKIKELEGEGILISESRGNLKLYSINKNFPLYKEYKNIILKTIGVENKLKEIIQKVVGIKTAYIYGSYAKDKMDTHSDIDLLIVGNHDILQLQSRLNKLQREIDREINVVNMEKKELESRIKKGDHFIKEILNKKHIKLIG